MHATINVQSGTYVSAVFCQKLLYTFHNLNCHQRGHMAMREV